MPTVPVRKATVVFKLVPLGLMFFLLLPTDRAAGECRSKHAARKVVEIERLSVSRLD
jgi:hypothetical protein